MNDVELLKHWIVKSGLSNRQFARSVLGRNERQLRRWLDGLPMPADLRSWVERLEDVGIADDGVFIQVGPKAPASSVEVG